MTATPGQQHQESHGQDCWDRIAGTGQPGCDSQDRTAETGQSEKKVGTVHPEQETEDKTARTGQQGKDSLIGQGDRTTVTGLLAKDIWDRTTETVQPGQVSLDRVA
jgi:hypothetical protein